MHHLHAFLIKLLLGQKLSTLIRTGLQKNDFLAIIIIYLSGFIGVMFTRKHFGF